MFGFVGIESRRVNNLCSTGTHFAILKIRLKPGEGLTTRKIEKWFSGLDNAPTRRHFYQKKFDGRCMGSGRRGRLQTKRKKKAQIVVIILIHFSLRSES